MSVTYLFSLEDSAVRGSEFGVWGLVGANLTPQVLCEEPKETGPTCSKRVSGLEMSPQDMPTICKHMLHKSGIFVHTPRANFSFVSSLNPKP